MNAAATVLATAAAVIWFAPFVALAAYAVRDRRNDREEARRRAEQDREVSAEWSAVLAATDTSLFAEVWADSLRRDLEDGAR